MVNPNKSTVFAGSISVSKLNQLINIIGFNHGTLPFTYLGVPIFKGKPKVIHLQPIVDKIIAKLSTWKASLLSIAGRVQMVKSVIQSMLTHSITVYNWPTSLLKDLEKSIKNFIWSGDTSKRKLVTVAWKKLCRPFDQGGLRIRSLIQLNSASNLKLCWNIY
uniref:RNA-directed DNA polymerase, putative n=1 Tax=Medicago truncatula TaxID=3880 RepID=Q2HUX0_MEDTR|nr:RNA-directed DNA polymerase, putative [Medicago truncatula]